MKTNIKKTTRLCFFKAALFLTLILCAFLFPSAFQTNAVKASAASNVMAIERYDIDITVGTDRKIAVKEQIAMRPNVSGSKFKRSLPLEGDRYTDLQVECVGETGYLAYVEDNENGGFIDLVCELYTPAGTTRTYNISYVMELGANDVKNGMRLDVVGFGWTVPLSNVTVTLHFPAKATIDELFVGEYGSSASTGKLTERTLSDDGKTLTLKADCLDTYVNVYNERVAEGITVCFTFEKGVLDNYTATRIFTDDLWKLLLGGAVCVGLAILALIFTRKKRDMITVVHISAPDTMDPMKMGKLLDGSADSEDVTSMIYYFAHKGYLTIDLTDERDPVFIKRVNALPANAPVHQKTLFDGLFKQGSAVSVSGLKEKFYEYADRAKMQVPMPKMYDKKSVFGYFAGGLLAVLFGFLSGWLVARANIGGGYTYWLGVFFGIPVVLIWVLGYIRENYRYKWKKRTHTIVFIVQLIVAVFFSLIYIGLMGRHVFTGWEKGVVCVAAFACLFITQGALSRTEAYTKTLGEILGFKDFIVVTEEDKIKFMLEEDPELYYKILPYAQVLGVTNEWENKFKNILVQPPQWCTGNDYTLFDYMVLNRCLNRAMTVAMTRPQQQSGGSSVGRSGGGGSFGGFGGGGHGGGGGSWS